jgi:hypothetical protein
MPLHRLPLHGQDRVEKDQARVVRLHDVAESIQGEACPGPIEFAPGQVDTDGGEHTTAHHQAPENRQRSGVPAACGRRHRDAFHANETSLCVYAAEALCTLRHTRAPQHQPRGHGPTVHNHGGVRCKSTYSIGSLYF